jgi:hypothetical protein
MIISPGFRVRGGKTWRNFLTERGKVQMKEGMLRVDWAREFPRASIKTQAKSFDSLTVVEKEEYTKAAETSSTIAVKRLQMISKLIGSYLLPIFKLPATG